MSTRNLQLDRIIVLTEDRSSVPILRSIFRQILAAAGLSCPVENYFHRGRGYLPQDWSAPPRLRAASLLELLPAKIRAYERVLKEENSLLAVVLDADDTPVDELFKPLAQCFQKFAPDLVRLIGIAVEEFEAWLLGDPEAVLAAYPDADRKELKRYPQDQIVGTWEWLARVILHRPLEDRKDRAYALIGAYKLEWAERIAPELDIRRNHSPSLQKFCEQFEHCLALLSERQDV